MSNTWKQQKMNQLIKTGNFFKSFKKQIFRLSLRSSLIYFKWSPSSPWSTFQVPKGSSLGSISATVTGAFEAPHFIHGNTSFLINSHEALFVRLLFILFVGLSVYSSSMSCQHVVQKQGILARVHFSRKDNLPNNTFPE